MVDNNSAYSMAKSCLEIISGIRIINPIYLSSRNHFLSGFFLNYPQNFSRK
jgi:hypothetical protein